MKSKKYKDRKSVMGRLEIHSQQPQVNKICKVRGEASIIKLDGVITSGSVIDYLPTSPLADTYSYIEITDQEAERLKRAGLLIDASAKYPDQLARELQRKIWKNYRREN